MAACVGIATGDVRPARVVWVSPSVSGADHTSYLTERLCWGPVTARLAQVYADRWHGIRMADYEVPGLLA